MAIEETILVEMLNPYVVEADAAGSVSLQFAGGGDRKLYVTESFSSAIPQGSSKGIVFSGNEQEAYRIISQGTDTPGGNYVILDRPLSDDVSSGVPVYLVNLVSRSTDTLAFAITADKIDVDPVTCYINISNNGTEFAPVYATGEVKATAVSTWTEAASMPTQANENGIRAWTVSATTGSTFRRNTPIQITDFDETFTVIDAAGSSTIVLGESVPPLYLADVSVTEYAWGSGSTTELNSSSTTSFETGGSTHAHTVANHVHIMNRNDTISFSNATTTMPFNDGDVIMVDNIKYQISSATSNSFKVGGLIQDVFSGTKIYGLFVPSQTVSVNLWRHITIATLPPIVNGGLGVQKVVITFSLNSDYQTTPYLSQTYYFARYPSIRKVEDLGDNKFRVWVDEMQPGAEHFIMTTTATAVSDWFGAQYLEGDLQFDVPDRLGWESDS